MSTINARPYSSPKNINLTKGLLRFGAIQPIASTPFDTSSYGLYVNSSGNLAYSKLGSVTVLGGGGGGAATWETLFLADSTFTITPDVTYTIAGNRATATDVLTVTNSAGASGSVIQITNAGSGNDIDGTSNTWSVSAAGLATFVGVTTTSDITSTGAAIDWDLVDDNASALSFDTNGQAGILEIVTSNGAELVKFGKNIQVTNGIATLISSSNTVSNLLVTNNTITTFGANADSSGVVVIRSTSLTTGALLQLQATEGTLNGGFYLVARDVTGSANVLTIGEDGKTTIAGADGSDMFVITAGDATIGGSLALTDNDNAATFTITNNTATSATVVVIEGSGVFTGSTTGSFMTVTPSGLTTGTAVYMPLAALTTGKGLHIPANALTTGEVLDISHTTSVIADGGSLVRLSSTGIDTGGATNGVLLDLSSTASTAGTQVKAVFSALTTGTGLDIVTSALTTGTAVSIVNASGIMTTTGEMLLVTANAATTCTGIVRVSGTGLTDGFAMEITGGGANATASGGVLNIAAGAATAGTAVKILTSGVYTGTTGVLLVSATAATTGNVAVITGTGLTSGTALLINATEATLTTGLYIRCNDGAATDFSVGKYGAVVIAGNAATDVFTITAGHAVITSGNLTLTSGNAVLTSGNLTLTSGTLTMTSGSATLTAGNLVLTAGTVITTPQVISNANTAISITHGVTSIANNAPSTHTLADGVVGQRKTIVCVTYTGDAVITPSNLAGGTTLTLNAAGDACDLVFLGTEWFVTNLYGTAALA